MIIFRVEKFVTSSYLYGHQLLRYHLKALFLLCCLNWGKFVKLIHSGYRWNTRVKKLNFSQPILNTSSLMIWTFRQFNLHLCGYSDC